MVRLIPLHWRKVERAVLHYGCECTGQVGSHRKYWKAGLTRPIIIPTYDQVPKFIISQIIKTLNVKADDFYKQAR